MTSPNGLIDPARLPLPDYVQGFTLSNNVADAANDIDIAVGKALRGDALVSSASVLTKRLDATFTAGNNGGGLDTGVKAISATYHIHALRRLVDGVCDAVFSLSATAPTVPAGYVRVQRLGAIRTDNSGNIRPFVQSGNRFLLATMVNDVNDTTLGNTAKLYALTVPFGVKVEALYRAATYDGVGGVGFVMFTSPDESDQAAAAQGPMTLSGAVQNGRGGGEFGTITNLSSQIRARADGSALPLQEFYIHTFGWNDFTIPRIGA